MFARARSCLLFGLALGLTASCSPARAPHAGPSVVLVTVDTLRADHLGCYGFPQDTSPEIDALAGEGVLFERALAGSSATTPSHATIFSSRYVREHSVGFENGGSQLVGAPLLSERFHEAGYATAAFIGNVVLRRGRGFERGFELYDDELPSQERNRPLVFERVAEDTTARALAWLEEQGPDAERPFFLWVHLQDPHGPYTAPGPYRGRFAIPPAPDERPLPIHDTHSGQGGIPAYQALDGITRPSLYHSRYADEIFYADHAVGVLRQAVERRAGPSGVVMLLTADHGESLGEDDQYFVHSVTTPDVAHVPLIVRAPGLAPGRRAEIVHHVDIMPTLLELAGLAVPEAVSGVSLVPLLKGDGSLPERIVYTDNGHELSAYGGDGFVRVTGVKAAWQLRESSEATPIAPSWKRYRWSPGAPWSETRETSGIALGQVGDYYRQAVPMVLHDDLSSEDRERLRLLGYVE